MGEGSEHNPFAPPAEHADRELGREVYTTRVLATYGQRFAGSFIDGLLYMATALPGVILYFVVWRNDWAASMDDTGEANFVMAKGAAVTMLGPLILAVYQWYLIAKSGQSLAKRWLRMRIVREETGALPGFVHGVVLRQWIFFFAGMMPYVGSCVGLADALAIFFGDRRQTLHDRVARTLVIQE
jgi:uncharacterized RDD family membrane protein YckC